MWRTCLLSNLVQVLHIDGDRNVGRVAVIEKVRKVDFDRNRADDFAKTWHLQEFHSPDFEHKGTEVLADERKLSIVEVDGIEVLVGEHAANGIIRQRKRISEVEEVSEVSPEDFLFESGEAERCCSTLLDGAGVVGRAKALTLEFVAEPADTCGIEIMAQEFDCVGIGKIEFGIGVKAGEPVAPVATLEFSQQIGHRGDRDVRVVLHGLPEVLR